jgi:glutamate synthase domain-containing protein 3
MIPNMISVQKKKAEVKYRDVLQSGLRGGTLVLRGGAGGRASVCESSLNQQITGSCGVVTATCSTGTVYI